MNIERLMVKKILPISIFVLVCIVIVLLGLQSLLGKNKSQGSLSITPTIFQGKQGSYPSNQTGKTNTSQNQTTNQTGGTSSTAGTQLTPEELKQKLPINTFDFTLNYSPRMEKYVVTLKTENGQGAYTQWLEKNPSYGDELQNAIITKQTINELHAALDYAKKNQLTPEKKAEQNSKEFTKNLNLLINLPFSFTQSLQSFGETPSPIPSSIPTPIPTGETSLQTGSGHGGYIYYAQCGDPYGSYLLPIQNGKKGEICTECSAGCGPTTAAMIISSYVDSTQTPPKVIESMSKAGVSISCDGTGIYQMYEYMKSVPGIKVSDVISLENAGAKDVVNDFRNYINGGWTLFTVANFTYGGHFFWVTDVTSDGRILAFDSFYGAGKLTPFDENQYNPYPYYIYAFAVKKI